MKKNDLMLILKKLDRKKIWNVRGGVSTGSIFQFEVGDKILKIQKNRDTYEGEYSFMIYCSWRIQNKTQILNSWKNDSSVGGTLMKGLANLEGEVIKSFKLSDFFDLEIHFESGKSLLCFCDQSSIDGFDTNWFLRETTTYYSISNNNTIEIEV